LGAAACSVQARVQRTGPLCRPSRHAEASRHPPPLSGVVSPRLPSSFWASLRGHRACLWTTQVDLWRSPPTALRKRSCPPTQFLLPAGASRRLCSFTPRRLSHRIRPQSSLHCSSNNDRGGRGTSDLSAWEGPRLPSCTARPALLLLRQRQLVLRGVLGSKAGRRGWLTLRKRQQSKICKKPNRSTTRTEISREGKKKEVLVEERRGREDSTPFCEGNMVRPSKEGGYKERRERKELEMTHSFPVPVPPYFLQGPLSILSGRPVTCSVPFYRWSGDCVCFCLAFFCLYEKRSDDRGSPWGCLERAEGRIKKAFIQSRERKRNCREEERIRRERGREG